MRGEDGAVAYAMICGSGSAGQVWQPVAEALGGSVLPVPLEPDVPAMAAAIRPAVERLPRSRVVIGTSLGALIALELARDVAMDALILMSSGFGITVAPSVLDAIAADAPGMLEQMARGVIADRGNQATVKAVARDFEARGASVLLHHMQVLARHRPQAVPDLPPTFVLCGARDPGVSLADHAELAMRCGAPLLAVDDAGHVPHLEQPEATLAWIRKAVRWAGV